MPETSHQARTRHLNGARRRLLTVGALAVVGAPAVRASPEVVAGGRELGVGPGQRFSRLADALREARDGDTITLAEGEYRGDVGVLQGRGVTLRGLGRGAVLHADGRDAEGKAILVVRAEARVENLEFRGCRVPSGNGAGIRFERGRLELRRCRFLDNENGLLSANEADMALDIRDCVFGDSPRHMGRLHHQLYVGAIGRLRLERSRFFNGFRGHLVKSRARENFILGNRLDDGPTGEGSYELEFPNGGLAVVAGNRIVQAPGTNNPAMLAIGAEAGPGSTGRLVLARNTFADGGVAEARFVRVWDERLTGGCEVLASDNLFAGEARIDRIVIDGEARPAHENNHRIARDALDADGRLLPDHPLARRGVGADGWV